MISKRSSSSLSLKQSFSIRLTLSRKLKRLRGVLAPFEVSLSQGSLASTNLLSLRSLQALPELPAFAFALVFTVVLALVFTAVLALVFTAVLALVFSVELELVSEIDFLLALFEDPFLETPLEVLVSLVSFTS